MVLASALNREFTFFEASESRFPEDFLLQRASEEFKFLKSPNRA